MKMIFVFRRSNGQKILFEFKKYLGV